MLEKIFEKLSEELCLQVCLQLFSSCSLLRTLKLTRLDRTQTLNETEVLDDIDKVLAL